MLVLASTQRVGPERGLDGEGVVDQPGLVGVFAKNCQRVVPCR
jgi:hypothetical protein